MEQLNPRDRAYVAGFRDGYRRAISELRGQSNGLLERRRAGPREVKEEQARLQDWAERLRVRESTIETKLDRLDALETKADAQLDALQPSSIAWMRSKTSA